MESKIHGVNEKNGASLRSGADVCLLILIPDSYLLALVDLRKLLRPRVLFKNHLPVAPFVPLIRVD